jgi:hypothetical protein
MLRFFIGLRPRVGGITHLIVLIKVCLLLLSLTCGFETTSNKNTLEMTDFSDHSGV